MALLNGECGRNHFILDVFTKRAEQVGDLDASARLVLGDEGLADLIVDVLALFPLVRVANLFGVRVADIVELGFEVRCADAFHGEGRAPVASVHVATGAAATGAAATGSGSTGRTVGRSENAGQGGGEESAEDEELHVELLLLNCEDDKKAWAFYTRVRVRL